MIRLDIVPREWNVRHVHHGTYEPALRRKSIIRSMQTRSSSSSVYPRMATLNWADRRTSKNVVPQTVRRHRTRRNLLGQTDSLGDLVCALLDRALDGRVRLVSVRG